MKFDELYKKVIDSCRAFEERRVPISLDFKIEDLRDALVESNDTIEQFKAKLESVHATAYADSVDAGMRERRLERSLWLARAYRAEARKNYWYARSCHEGDNFLVSIDGSPVKYIGCIKRTSFDWLKVWSEVEHKCLKKAEEYK